MGKPGRPGKSHTGNLQLVVFRCKYLSLSCDCEQGEAAAGIREDGGAAGGFRFGPDLPTQPLSRRLLPSPTQLPTGKSGHGS